MLQVALFYGVKALIGYLDPFGRSKNRLESQSKLKGLKIKVSVCVSESEDYIVKTKPDMLWRHCGAPFLDANRRSWC